MFIQTHASAAHPETRLNSSETNPSRPLFWWAIGEWGFGSPHGSLKSRLSSSSRINPRIPDDQFSSPTQQQMPYKPHHPYHPTTRTFGMESPPSRPVVESWIQPGAVSWVAGTLPELAPNLQRKANLPPLPLGGDRAQEYGKVREWTVTLTCSSGFKICLG